MSIYFYLEGELASLFPKQNVYIRNIFYFQLGILWIAYHAVKLFFPSSVEAFITYILQAKQGPLFILPG
jgi:hypothetical protein